MEKKKFQAPKFVKIRNKNILRRGRNILKIFSERMNQWKKDPNQSTRVEDHSTDKTDIYEFLVELNFEENCC